MRGTLPRAPAVLLLGALLAGCAGAPTRGPFADAADPADAGGVVLADVTSAGCAYNDLIFLLPRERVQALLPEGLVARAAFQEGLSAVVMNVIHCDEGFRWSGADYFVVVETIDPPPRVEAFDAANRTPRTERAEGVLRLDVYMLGAYTGHSALASIFRAGGMPVEPASVSKTPLPVPVGSLARGAVADPAGDVVTYTVAGRDVGTVTASHRQWREGPDGLVLVERDMSLDGAGLALTQGPAQCAIRPGAALARVVQDAPCVLGQDTTNGFAWEGRAYFFPRLRAVDLSRG